MVYHRPAYLVRLPKTVKELLLDMQTKSKELKWSIMGGQKDVTLTLTWQCQKKKSTRKKKNEKSKSRENLHEDLNQNEWISDAESTQYQRFSKQLELMQTISKLASSISQKPLTGELMSGLGLSVMKSQDVVVSPQDTDDGYLTEKATPDEMHVYPKVVVRPPFYLPSRETLINGEEESVPNKQMSPSAQIPPPLPPPPPPPIVRGNQFQFCNRSRTNSTCSKTCSQEKEEEEEPRDADLHEDATLGDDVGHDYFEATALDDVVLHDIPESNYEGDEQEPAHLEKNNWETSKSSIDRSTEDGNTSFDRLLTHGSDFTDNESGSAIRFGKYVKFRESDSAIFHDSSPFYYDSELGESDLVGAGWEDTLNLQELDNSPRHKLSYVEPDSTENLNKKKKVKRKPSLKKLFASWQPKQKYDKKKGPKSPKTGRKIISPKPLYSQKNYVSRSSNLYSAGSDGSSYTKVMEYQRVKTGKNRQTGDAPETWDSSLESHQLQHSVDHCLRSCDSILTRKTHAPSDL